MAGNKNEIHSLFRIAAVMTILCIAVVIAATRFQRIPFIGKLPGDFELVYPGVSVYLPVTTSIVIALIMAVIAYVIHDSSNNND